MKLDTLFEKKSCVFALEIFPPKRKSGASSIYGMLDKLNEVPVDYISVTYSAGGDGAKEFTCEIAKYLKHKMNIEPLAHLTCRNSDANEIKNELLALKQGGIENILALRGDKNPNVKACEDFKHASDLMAEINNDGNFYIAGACYPEGHPESETLMKDVESLKLKVEAGAKNFVSQLFFDNGKFFRFLNLARKKGIICPIEAGVMPITNIQQIKRTIELSSASLPTEFTHMASRFADDEDGFYKAGVEYAIMQCRDLIESGVDGIHLYAMNKPKMAKEIWDGISDLLPDAGK